MRNIIFLLNSPYPDYTGGRETWINQICNRICNEFNVTIISYVKEANQQNMGTFTNIDDRIQIYRVSSMSSHYLWSKITHSYLLFINKLIFSRQMVKKAIQIMKEDQEYIIISMDTVFMAYTAKKICGKCKNTKHIASVRGPHAEFYAVDYPLLKKIIMKMERKNLMHADAIWANGWDTQCNLKNKGFDSTVIKNGLDYDDAFTTTPIAIRELCGISPKEKVIVTIGTLQDEKGYIELIKAISHLHRMQQKVHLVGVGKGKADRYMKIAEELEVADLIHFVGEQRNTVAYAKAADIVACLAIGSGIGMACLESMSAGKPIIAWNHIGYTQLLESGKSAILVETNNVIALAEAINYVHNNYEKCEKWGEEAREVTKQFDWKNIVEVIESEIDNLTEEQE